MWVATQGVEELNLAAMTMIEEAVEDGSPLGGFSLDLVKALNQMGRPLVQKCMVHLGFPTRVAQTWITSLSHLRRYPTFGKYVAPGVPSTTGFPEGDSLSVLAMLSVCFFFSQRIRTTGAAMQTTGRLQAERRSARQMLLRRCCSSHRPSNCRWISPNRGACVRSGPWDTCSHHRDRGPSRLSRQQRSQYQKVRCAEMGG